MSIIFIFLPSNKVTTKYLNVEEERGKGENQTAVKYRQEKYFRVLGNQPKAKLPGSRPPGGWPGVCPLLRKTSSLSAGEDVLFLQTPEDPETPPPGAPPSFCPTRGGEGLVPGQASAVGAPPPKTPPPWCVKKGETRACRHLPVGTQHLGSCLTPAWAEDGEEQDAGLIMGLVQGFHRLQSPAAHAVLGQARQRGHVGRPGRAR